MSSSPDPLTFDSDENASSSPRRPRRQSISPRKPMGCISGNERALCSNSYSWSTAKSSSQRSARAHSRSQSICISPSRSSSSTKACVSPVRIRLTLETERPDGKTRRMSPVRIIQPSENSRPANGSITTTTVVPLKGGDDSAGEDDRLNHVTTRAGDMVSPRLRLNRSNRTPALVNYGSGDCWAPTPPSKLKRKKQVESPSRVSNFSIADSTHSIEGHSTIQASRTLHRSRPKSRSRSRRMEITPRRISQFIDDQICNTREGSIGDPKVSSERVDAEVIGDKSQSFCSSSAFHSKGQDTPLSPQEMNSDPNNSTAFEGVHGHSRKREQGQTIGSPISERENAGIKHGRICRANSTSDISNGRHSVDPTEEHHEYDTVLESEGFSMVSIESLQSASGLAKMKESPKSRSESQGSELDDKPGGHEKGRSPNTTTENEDSANRKRYITPVSPSESARPPHFPCQNLEKQKGPRTALGLITPLSTHRATQAGALLQSIPVPTTNNRPLIHNSGLASPFVDGMGQKLVEPDSPLPAPGIHMPYTPPEDGLDPGTIPSKDAFHDYEVRRGPNIIRQQPMNAANEDNKGLRATFKEQHQASNLAPSPIPSSVHSEKDSTASHDQVSSQNHGKRESSHSPFDDRNVPDISDDIHNRDERASETDESRDNTWQDDIQTIPASFLRLESSKFEPSMIDHTLLARQDQWQRERAAVSRQIQNANKSQVIVIDSDDEVDEICNLGGQSNGNQAHLNKTKEIKESPHIKNEVLSPMIDKDTSFARGEKTERGRRRLPREWIDPPNFKAPEVMLSNQNLDRQPNDCDKSVTNLDNEESSMAETSVSQARSIELLKQTKTQSFITSSEQRRDQSFRSEEDSDIDCKASEIDPSESPGLRDSNANSSHQCREGELDQSPGQSCPRKTNLLVSMEEKQIEHAINGGRDQLNVERQSRPRKASHNSNESRNTRDIFSNADSAPSKTQKASQSLLPALEKLNLSSIDPTLVAKESRGQRRATEVSVLRDEKDSPMAGSQSSWFGAMTRPVASIFRGGDFSRQIGSKSTKVPGLPAATTSDILASSPSEPLSICGKWTSAHTRALEPLVNASTFYTSAIFRTHEQSNAKRLIGQTITAPGGWQRFFTTADAGVLDAFMVVLRKRSMFPSSTGQIQGKELIGTMEVATQIVKLWVLMVMKGEVDPGRWRGVKLGLVRRGESRTWSKQDILWKANRSLYFKEKRREFERQGLPSWKDQGLCGPFHLE